MSWSEAYASLAHADAARTAPLSAEELERLATAAFMIGRAEDHLRALERAHHAHLDAGAPLRAVRCAIWLAIFVAQRGEQGRATGWLSRAQRLLAHRPADCVERGYLLVPAMIRHEDAGEVALAIAAATEAAGIADRFRDADLLALALHEHGLMLARQGEVEQGLALVDEAMVAVCAGELSPIVTGVLYCSVISGCQELYALRRAQEWTAALTRWCEQQPEMVAFTGRCLVHRAELMQLHGAWRDALAETRRARERFARAGGESHPSRERFASPRDDADPDRERPAGAGDDARASGSPAGDDRDTPAPPPDRSPRPGDEGAFASARYREGELRRLRGESAAAERAYRDAHLSGGAEPLPGLALLRLAQGDGPAAAATLRRALGETSAPLQRARLLPAWVDVALATGDEAAARDACAELERIADERAATGLLHALVAHARGAVELHSGDATAALRALRDACETWRMLEAPYEGARSRVLLALACRALGDEATAALELDAACATFAQLGAEPDLAEAEQLAEHETASATAGANTWRRRGATRGFANHTDPANASAAHPHGLTPRELEVLRLVAGGSTNRAIAAELVLSERTVDRHVSNILAKLRLPSRTAATAYAYEHELV